MVETQYPKKSLAEKLYQTDLDDISQSSLDNLAKSAHLLESQLALKIQQLNKERTNSDYWYDKFISVSRAYTTFTGAMTAVLKEGE